MAGKMTLYRYHAETGEWVPACDRVYILHANTKSAKLLVRFFEMLVKLGILHKS